jgi:hypothetical protein
MNQKNKNSKLLKIVYFDESSAIDFLDIRHGGRFVELKSKEKKGASKLIADAQASIGKSKIFEFLQNTLPFKGSAGVKFDFEKTGEEIIKQTISNTFLSKYYQEAESDKEIEKIEDYKITFPNNGLTFIKSVMPIIKTFKEDFIENEMGDLPIDLNRFEELTDDLKGYYTVKAENKEGDIKILRFNIKAFRNNYKLSDLAIMKLKFYAIKIGEISTKEDSLNFMNELMASGENAASDLKNNLTQPIYKKDKKDHYDLFDVVLAGVIKNSEKG